MNGCERTYKQKLIPQNWTTFFSTSCIRYFAGAMYYSTLRSLLLILGFIVFFSPVTVSWSKTSSPVASSHNGGPMHEKRKSENRVSQPRHVLQSHVSTSFDAAIVPVLKYYHGKPPSAETWAHTFGTQANHLKTGKKRELARKSRKPPCRSYRRVFRPSTDILKYYLWFRLQAPKNRRETWCDATGDNAH